MHCKICQNSSLESFEGEETYYYCQRCELIFLAEEEIPSPAEERARYEEHDNTDANEGYVRMFREFIDRTIKPYSSEIKSALDFGCGPGPVLADLLTEEGFRVDIYDPYFYPVKVFQGKKYDLISCTEVFEHLKDPLAVIETLVSLLAEGGYLAVMTSFHHGIDGFEEWWYKRDSTHITFYNDTTFTWIAEEFSLEKVFSDDEKYCLLKTRL